MRSSPQTPALSGAHRCTPECAALYGPLFQHCNVEAVRPPACYDAFGVTGAVFRAWLENANIFPQSGPDNSKRIGVRPKRTRGCGTSLAPRQSRLSG